MGLEQVKLKREFTNFRCYTFLISCSLCFNIIEKLTLWWCVSIFLLRVLVTTLTICVFCLAYSQIGSSSWSVSAFAGLYLASFGIIFTHRFFLFNLQFQGLWFFFRLLFQNIFQVNFFRLQKFLHFAHSLVNRPLIFSVSIREHSERYNVFLDWKIELFEFFMIFDRILSRS